MLDAWNLKNAVPSKGAHTAVSLIEVAWEKTAWENRQFQINWKSALAASRKVPVYWLLGPNFLRDINEILVKWPSDQCSMDPQVQLLYRQRITSGKILIFSLLRQEMPENACKWNSP